MGTGSIRRVDRKVENKDPYRYENPMKVEVKGASTHPAAISASSKSIPPLNTRQSAHTDQNISTREPRQSPDQSPPGIPISLLGDCSPRAILFKLPPRVHCRSRMARPPMRHVSGGSNTILTSQTHGLDFRHVAPLHLGNTLRIRISPCPSSQS